MSMDNSNEIEDLWSIPEFKPEDNPHPVVEKSTFSMLFPKSRENYFRSNWNEIKNILTAHGVDCHIDYIKGAVEVSTTEKMWDPYIIIKAKDFMKLLCRFMPVDSAKNILKDDYYCEIIRLDPRRMNQEKFYRRRSRLIGPEGKTVKCLEILCDCSIVIFGYTAAVLGSIKAIKNVTHVINECMYNVHPIYNIKALMIKKELENNEEMKNEIWSKFIPKYKAKSVKRKLKKIVKKDSAAFPPPPLPRKVDLELETGEYFLKEDERRAKKSQAKVEKQKAKVMEKKKLKNNVYEPVEEKPFKSKEETDLSISVEKIKKNLKKIKN